jgi:hypothetical protein
MSSMTSTQTASAMYNKAKNIASGKIDLEVSGDNCDGYSLPWFLLHGDFIHWYEHLLQV